MLLSRIDLGTLVVGSCLQLAVCRSLFVVAAGCCLLSFSCSALLVVVAIVVVVVAIVVVVVIGVLLLAAVGTLTIQPTLPLSLNLQFLNSLPEHLECLVILIFSV